MEPYIAVTKSGKKDIYEEIIPQIDSLIRDESDFIANLANCVSVLKMAFPERVSWVGFYMNRSNELVLGPFQGKPACVRIAVGKGVCGTSAYQRKSIIVPDVRAFPGHIFCDPDAKSEIVVPVLRGADVLAVLDLDSSSLDAFDEVDREYLERVAKLISEKFPLTHD